MGGCASANNGKTMTRPQPQPQQQNPPPSTPIKKLTA